MLDSWREDDVAEDEEERGLARRAAAGDKEARKELRELRERFGTTRFLLLRSEHDGRGSRPYDRGATEKPLDRGRLKMHITYLDSRPEWTDRLRNVWATPLGDLEELSDLLENPPTTHEGDVLIYDRDKGEIVPIGSRRRKARLEPEWIVTGPRGDATMGEIVGRHRRGETAASIAESIGATEAAIRAQLFAAGAQSSPFDDEPRTRSTDERLRLAEREARATGDPAAQERVRTIRRQYGLEQ